MNTTTAAPPLVVDLDDTLINTDLLIESAFAVARCKPISLLRLPAWLGQGRARTKAELAARAPLDVDTLPYNQALIDYLREQKAAGRRLILATAADRRYAARVADHLALFDVVLASDGHNNLSGHAKLEAIRAYLDGAAFDYAGDHANDLVIWRAARRALVVGANARLLARVRDECDVERTFGAPRGGVRTWLRAMRAHQWLKNILVLVPVIAAHDTANPVVVGAAVMAFIAFCVLASSVYLLNDLIDLGDDRRHPTKRERPLASGRIPLAHAVLVIPLLVIAAFFIAFWLPPVFMGVLAVYYALTLAYSLGLKQVALIDVLALAALYTLRIIAGGAATATPLSFWLLALSMSLFLSLAMAKRCTELLTMSNQNDDTPLGRGYMAADLVPLRSLGTAAGYAAVVILALYVNSESITNHYNHPQRVWLLCPIVAYWISRIWLVTLRGRMNDDPIIFAARDRASLACIALGAAVMVSAL